MDTSSTASSTRVRAGAFGGIEARVDQLIIGRKLLFPVYDSSGVLLLSSGTRITPQLKSGLKQRGIRSVVVHDEDSSNTTLHEDFSGSEPPEARLGEELSADPGAGNGESVLRVSNVGTPVRDRLVSPQCEDYDAAFTNELVSRSKNDIRTLETVLQDVLRPRGANGTRIQGLTSERLGEFAVDFDAVLSTIFDHVRGPSLAEHSLRVAVLGMAIAVEMGLDAENVGQVGAIGFVQDCGMARVPQHIREANRPLSRVEFLEIQKHPIYSAEILKRVSGLPRLAPLVAHQVHEKPDGSGYPAGREGNRIHMFARMLHVADAYHAMISPRPYRRPLMPYAAMECLVRQAQQGMVDRQVVRGILRSLSLFPLGSYVTLSDGSVARVRRRNGDAYDRPIVRRLQDKNGRRIDPAGSAALVDLARSELTIMQALPAPGSEEMGYSSRLLVPPRSLFEDDDSVDL